MKKTGYAWVSGVLSIVVFLSGCASKEDQALYAKIRERSPELKTLQQTEKVVFHSGKEDETIVIATYLPQEKVGSHEEFVLAVYPDSGLAGRNSFLLDGKAPELLRRLPRSQLSESIRRTIPEWFTLYQVHFASNSQKKMTLSIRDKTGEEKEMIFYKGPKYLVTKPKF